MGSSGASLSPGSYRALRPSWSRHSSAVQGSMSEPQRASRKWRSSASARVSDAPPQVDELRPYYEDLIAEFFPAQVQW